jgi:signal transduction histidine kinase
VASVFDALKMVAQEKGITLLHEGIRELPEIQADEARLFNAFYNLVNNAVSEVPKGGSITIKGQMEQMGKTLHLLVIDTGRGMPAEVRDSLFSSRAISRKKGGTGLGTKIVKDIVEAHSGVIAVESEINVGTTFHIHLPMERPRASPP